MAYDEFTAKMVRTCSELEHALNEKDAQYQQLLAQAVRFAEAYRKAHLSDWRDLVMEDMAEEMATKDPVYAEAQAFLKEHHDTHG